jgi:hypothetical protein
MKNHNLPSMSGTFICINILNYKVTSSRDLSCDKNVHTHGVALIEGRLYIVSSRIP